MFDFFAEPLAAVLAFFYSIGPNYAVAVVLLTLVIMIVLTPLTLKSTRSMTAMQEIQPEVDLLVRRVGPERRHQDDDDDHDEAR